MESLLLLPFKFVSAPDVRLSKPTWVARPHAMLVFAAVFATYFIFAGGVIYDLITETPSIGQTRDPRTGMVKPQAVLPGRLNSQYIIEGLSASFMFCLGGAGFILLDLAATRGVAEKNSFMAILGGVLFILVSYNICALFIRIKVPNYLR
mmetsp:Transcript_114432/g.160615  ORF Transcript_114432/g.160615 Transcript_114432/m.160615 type:complete len:150 (+) Transcript_114432:25-474(+)